MSERFFRIVQGVVLMVALYFDLNYVVYAYIGIILFEGISNWRIPIIFSRIRYGSNTIAVDSDSTSSYNFEAERVLRLIVAIFVILSFVLYNELLWFFPWFIAIMLLSAGITNICPMFLFLRWMGFR
jgi:hypothetical protein